MGISTILCARRVLLMAFGENKAATVQQAVEGPGATPVGWTQQLASWPGNCQAIAWPRQPRVQPTGATTNLGPPASGYVLGSPSPEATEPQPAYPVPSHRTYRQQQEQRTSDGGARAQTSSPICCRCMCCLRLLAACVQSLPPSRPASCSNTLMH